jgi:chromosome segregation ATPase
LLNNRSDELEKLKKAANGSLKDLNNESKGVKVSLQEKTENLEELDRKLKAANDSLKEKTNEFKKELSSTKGLLNSRSDELKVSKRNSEKLDEALEQELNGAKSSLEKTRTNLSSKNNRLDELEAVSIRQDKLMASSNKQLEDQNSKLTELKMKLQTAAAEKPKYEKKLSGVQEENQRRVPSITTHLFYQM